MKRHKSFLIVVGIALLCSLQSLAAQEKPIAILHARLIDGIGGPPIEDAVLILEGSKIKYSGPANPASVPPCAQLIEPKGKTVMPGLADIHVHLHGAWYCISAARLRFKLYLSAAIYSRLTPV